MVGTAVSSWAWAEVVSHDARFEHPDVIGFADGGPGGVNWRGGPWAAEGRLHRAAFVPKPDGSPRRLAVLDPAVHAHFRHVVAGVAGPVERSLGPEVAGGRCVATGPVLALEPWRRAWRRHARRSRGLRSGPVLHLDVRDCFASIRPHVVLDSLVQAGAGREDAAAVHGMLVRFESDGVRGLPVGPEPSAVLANAALAAGDRALRALGVPFVRWCDDVLVGLGTADPADVEQAWEGALGAVGLRPAPEKTRIVEPSEQMAASCALSVPSRPPAVAEYVLPSAPELCERTVAALDGPDRHLARAEVARLGLAGGREAGAVLRRVRARAPDLAPTAEWGLRR